MRNYRSWMSLDHELLTLKMFQVRQKPRYGGFRHSASLLWGSSSNLRGVRVFRVKCLVAENSPRDSRACCDQLDAEFVPPNYEPSYRLGTFVVCTKETKKRNINKTRQGFPLRKVNGISFESRRFDHLVKVTANSNWERFGEKTRCLNLLSLRRCSSHAR